MRYTVRFSGQGRKFTSCARAENKHLTEEADIEKAIKLGEYIRNGTMMLQGNSCVLLTRRAVFQRLSHCTLCGSTDI